jgi:putative tricarboxylic transport membrane protein
MLALFGLKGGGTLAETPVGAKVSTLTDGLRSTIRHWRVVLVSSLIGFGAGLIPGISGTLASFVAYGQAARMSKNPEAFGKGAVEGVIAPETANDADKGGALIPTLVFGIPGGVIMAVLLTGLLIHGVPAGPNLLRGDLHIVYVIIVASLIPRFVAAAIVLLIGSRAVAITKMRGDVLAPLIVMVAMVGVFSLRNEIIDVAVAVVFAYVGYGLDRFGFSRLTLIIAFVLGGLIESSFHQTLQTFGLTGFIERPISLSLVVVSVVILVLPPVLRRRRRRRPELERV